MGTYSGQTKKITELNVATTISDNDLVLVELASGGTRTMQYGDLVAAMFESFKTNEDKMLSFANVSNVQTEDATKIPSSALVDSMSKLSAVMFREAKAPYGFFGIEQNIDTLMGYVADEEWDKFAIGDFFTETTSSGEKIEFEVASKNGYLYCGDQGSGLTKPHIICVARDCLNTLYKYNDTNTNSGGYAGSKMPAQLEVEAAKFSAKLRGYMQTVRRLENNKGTFAWASRRIMLPSTTELLGNSGFADAYSGGPVAGSLELFTGGNAHRMKGQGYKKATQARMWYWLEDPSSINTAAFCRFHYYGTSDSYGASYAYGVAPLIVLAPAA